MEAIKVSTPALLVKDKYMDTGAYLRHASSLKSAYSFLLYFRWRIDVNLNIHRLSN
jgi:hypothetical protein